MRRTLTANGRFHGDSRQTLEGHVADRRIDLVYLDPSFRAHARRDVLFEPPTGQGELDI